MGWIRLNFLHPPFNNVKARQAVLWAVDQEAHLKATFVDPRFYVKCGSFLTCGTPYESDANTEWFKKGPNRERARQLLQESGYKGEPVTLLQATNILYMTNSAQILAQELRDAGIWAELDYEGKSLKSQMRKADRLKAPRVLILGEEELKKNRAVLRDMAAKGQEEVPLDEVVGRMTGKK